MTREEFTALAIENGWTIIVITHSIAIFTYPHDHLTLTTSWAEGSMVAVKRERSGELTHYNELSEVTEDAARWIKAPRQIRAVRR